MENLIILGVPEFGHITLIVMCLNVGAPNNNHFPLAQMEK